MDTRKVQQLGPSTLAMTLPAEWARDAGVEKGDEIAIRTTAEGTLSVIPESAQSEETEATITVGDFDAEAVERAIIGQYVLGRRVIHVTAETALEDPHINAVYSAESQLMGLGVIEETPERITIRCSVDPEDFDLANLLTRLENTGQTMRSEAMKSMARRDTDLAERALNRERQANKIFVLILRLIFTSYRNPAIAREMGLEDGFPLIAYRSVAKNLELIADNAEKIAEIVLDEGGNRLGLDDATVRRIRDHNEQVDELTELAVEAVVSRDFETAMRANELFNDLSERELDLMKDLPELSQKRLLQVREVLVALQQTSEHAVRIIEIATNLALNEPSEFTTIS